MAHAQDTLYVYGPAPAAFERKAGVKVELTAGPAPQWIEKAKSDAAVLYSGAENRMTDFVTAMEGRLHEKEVRPLYLRPLAILVRPGNPKRISGVKDILAPGVKVLVVNGAGQTGGRIWRDAKVISTPSGVYAATLPVMQKTAPQPSGNGRRSRKSTPG